MPDETNEKSPSPQEWRALYTAAECLFALSPWEWMGDNDVFAVKNPATGEVGYCVMMGGAGEVFGMSVYRDDAGLKTYLRLKSAIDKNIVEDWLFENHALTVTFEKDRSHLKAADKKTIKDLEINFKKTHALPLFRSYRPGYLDWPLTAEECLFLTTCIEQGIHVAEKYSTGPKNYLTRLPDKLLMRQKDSSNKTWTNTWFAPQLMHRVIRIQSEFDENALKNINRLPKMPKAAWEVDYFYAPAFIQENKTQRPYFPMTLLFCDHHSHFIIDIHVTRSGQHLVEIPKQLLSSLQKQPFRPAVIYVSKEDILFCLKPILEKMQIDIKLKEHLPIISDARAGMGDFLRKKI